MRGAFFVLSWNQEMGGNNLKRHMKQHSKRNEDISITNIMADIFLFNIGKPMKKLEKMNYDALEQMKDGEP